MKIVADDKIPFLKGVFEPFAEIDYLPGDQIKTASLKNADALLTRSVTFCNEQLLEDTPVRFIASATIGDDHIDKEYCLGNHIRWATSKGCNAGAVEQYVTSALLQVAKQLDLELGTKTLGIIGAGNIGSRVARVAEILGMKVLLNDPPRARVEGDEKFVKLKAIRAEADIITLHVPLTFGGVDKTFNLLDEDFFSGSNKSIVLINTSRGAVVDSDVLKMAGSNSWIRFMVLDVWENEPQIDPELLDLADIATPHIAGYSILGKANGTATMVHAVSDFFGLDLTNWYPELPDEHVKVVLNGLEMNFQHLLYQVFNHVYLINRDSGNFKSAPENFELFRRNYRFRKDNSFFDLYLENASKNDYEKLEQLGFNLDFNICK